MIHLPHDEHWYVRDTWLPKGYSFHSGVKPFSAISPLQPELAERENIRLDTGNLPPHCQSREHNWILPLMS
jgi:hypothetical protein